MTESTDYTKSNVVYMWMFINSRATYIGESCVSLKGRFMTHVRAWLQSCYMMGSRARQSGLCRQMTKMGIKSCFTMPIFIWENPVRKVVRLEREGYLVYWRNPRLNKAGKANYKLEKNKATYELPKRKKFRHVKRLVELKRKQKRDTENRNR